MGLPSPHASSMTLSYLDDSNLIAHSSRSPCWLCQTWENTVSYPFPHKLQAYWGSLCLCAPQKVQYAVLTLEEVQQWLF
jgi:hypothetical protein